MTVLFITYFILILCLIYTVSLGLKLWRQPSVILTKLDYLKLGASGIIAFIADTVGVGSFAVNIALAKLLNTFRDEELPAVNNGAQVIPGTIESLFFMKFVDVDITTLITLVAATCLGGVVGSLVVSRLSKQAIRIAMIGCFILIISLLVCHQFHVFPTEGEVTELHAWKLVAGFLGLMLCGALTSVGIGLFAMVQGVLFMLNVSPLVAFPIMTTAGAMQQPLTSLVFLQQNKIPLKKTLILSLAGCVGVFITLPLFNYLTVTWLHSLLLVILIYNLISVSRAYWRAKPVGDLRVQQDSLKAAT